VRSRYERGAWERRRRKAPGTSVQVADRVELPVSVEAAWQRLREVEGAAACLPGLVAGSLHPAGDGAFEATMRQTTLGVTASWALRAEFVASDADRRLEVRLSGEDARLGMTMSGNATVTVADAGGRAALDYRSDVRVEGRLAATGGPIIRGVVEQTLKSFVDSLAGREPEARRGLRGRLRR